MSKPLLWNLNETARQLGGISTRTVRRLVAAGELTRVRIGRRVLIPDQSIQAYIERNMYLAHNDDCVGPDVQQSMETSTCQENAKTETRTVFTGVRTRRTGGLVSPTQAAKDLAAVLELPTERKRKRC